MKQVFLICAFVFGLMIPSQAQLPNEALARELVAQVEQGEVKEVKNLLKSGADVNFSIPSRSPFYIFFISRQIYLDGLTRSSTAQAVYISALHANASRANAKILPLLLKAGANIDAGDSKGKTPLMYALRQPGGESFALALLQQGANYTSRDSAGNSTMHYAALGGNLEGIYLTKSGGVDINTRNVDGMTPLHVAVIRSPVRIVEEMLALGADLKARDNAGLNALHYAAGYGSRDLVKFIYEKAPQLFTENFAGANPLDIAHLAGNDEIAIFFRRKGHNFGDYRYEELVQAVANGDAELTRALLRDGANPNRPTDIFPIHTAAEAGDLDCIEVLLRYGARLDLPDPKGRLPLRIAIESAQPDAALLFMEKGSPPESAWLPPMVWNLREEAWKAKYWPMVKSVIQRVENPNLSGGPLEIPALHYAAYLGLTDVTQTLLHAGADPSLLDASGWMPLHWAVVKREVVEASPEKVRIAKMLLAKGSPANKQSSQAKELPHKQPYLARRVPANASPFDILDYALPIDSNMRSVLLEAGGDTTLLAADFYENGAALLDMQLFDAAQVEFNKALKRESRHAEAYWKRGKCKLAQGMLESAAIDFAAALEYRPIFPEVHLEQGKCMLELKRYEEAEQALGEAMAQGLRSGEAYFLRGRTRLALGNTQGACSDFDMSAEKGHPQGKMAKQLNCVE